MQMENVQESIKLQVKNGNKIIAEEIITGETEMGIYIYKIYQNTMNKEMK